MYRQHENPHTLELQLESILVRCKEYGTSPYDYEKIMELEERINFAYQDEEYDELYC